MLAHSGKDKRKRSSRSKAKATVKKIVAKTKSAGAKASRPWLAAYPPDVKWDAEIPERRLYALMDHAVERYGAWSPSGPTARIGPRPKVRRLGSCFVGPVRRRPIAANMAQ